jgi:hypothetical protein|tara:strand:+ start:1294 stop:1785 length:492 start_codon:yes stop_codon:yes gene_type:complete
METNPVGNPIQVNELESKVNELLNAWKTENPIKKGWFGFLSNVKVSFNKICAFLINSLDEFIQLVDDKLGDGADKKATVMVYVEKLYDEIVTLSLPIFLKPFNIPIKRFVIMVIVSGAIDFVVAKYRDGSWRNKWNDIADDAEDGILGNEESTDPVDGSVDLV